MHSLLFEKFLEGRRERMKLRVIMAKILDFSLQLPYAFTCFSAQSKRPEPFSIPFCHTMWIIIIGVLLCLLIEFPLQFQALLWEKHRCTHGRAFSFVSICPFKAIMFTSGFSCTKFIFDCPWLYIHKFAQIVNYNVWPQ